MAYVPLDPSQPLPEEPDTQDLDDEYANAREAREARAAAAAAAAAAAVSANATTSLGQIDGGAAAVGGGPRGMQGGAADSDVRITRRGTRYSPNPSPARPADGARGAGPARALQPRTFLGGSGTQTDPAPPSPPAAPNPSAPANPNPPAPPPPAPNLPVPPPPAPPAATSNFAWGKHGSEELNLRIQKLLDAEVELF